MEKVSGGESDRFLIVWIVKSRIGLESLEEVQKLTSERGFVEGKERVLIVFDCLSSLVKGHLENYQTSEINY